MARSRAGSQARSAATRAVGTQSRGLGASGPLVSSREIGEFPHVLGRPGGACSLPRSPSCSKTRETARGEEHGTGPDVRLPASDLTAGSGPPRSNDVSGRPRQQFPPSAPGRAGIHVPDPEGQHNSAAAPAQPGSQVTAGQLPGFSRRSGVTPVHDDLGSSAQSAASRGWYAPSATRSLWHRAPAFLVVLTEKLLGFGLGQSDLP